MSKYTIVGLDCEMTGGRFEPQFKTCQVGIAYSVENWIKSDVGWDDYEYTDEALQINKFSHKRIKDGPPPFKVSEKLTGWCRTVNPQKGSLIAVGWGVDGDLRFVRRDLSALGECFAWRYINLTSVCTFLGGLRGRYGLYSATTWKQKAKKHAQRVLDEYNIPHQPHDAGYDALIALYGYEWLRSVIRIHE